MSRFMTIKAEEIAEALKNVKVIAVMDRCEGFSYPFCKVRDYRDGSDRL